MSERENRKPAALWLAEGLRERGVNWVATLCGHGLDPLFAAARDAGLRLVDTRNEQTAAYIADAYGRLTGKPGVCAVSSGVAVANALTGAVNAFFDGAPMLLVSGSADRARLGMGGFQDLDQAMLAKSVTRYSRRIDSPSHVLRRLDEAWRAASDRRPLPGPAHLMFPLDVQRSPVSKTELLKPAAAAPAASPPGDARAVADAIAKAERPLIVAGSGVFYSGESSALHAFARQQAIPVVTPIWDRGVFDRDSEVFLGIIGAATGSVGLLAEADVIVMSGAASDYRVGYLEPSALAPRATVLRYGAPWLAVQHEYAGRKAAPKTAWLNAARRKNEAFRETIEQRGAQQAGAAGGTHAIHIVRAIAETLPEDGVLLIDGGSIGQWAHQLLTARRYPSHWLTCGRSGVVGWGIGGSMAARLAYPKRPVVLLSGDGSFTFNAGDIECAVRQQLPFVAIVADDQSWGITETGHRKQWGEAIGSHLGPIDFAGLAKSLGARGVRVNTPLEVAAELLRSLELDTVTVIHVPIAGGNPA